MAAKKVNPEADKKPEIMVVESTGDTFYTSTDVEYRGRKYTVEFNEDFFTKRLRDEFVSGEKSNIDMNIEVILANVKSWTLPHEITTDAVESVNVFLLDAVVNAMIAEVNPNLKVSSTT